MKLNVSGLEALGMREDVVAVLRDGTDMCLDRAPSPKPSERKDNYSSFTSHRNPSGDVGWSPGWLS